VNSWKVILASLVIFAAGVMTGGLVANHSHRWHHPFENTLRPPTDIPLPRPMAEKIGKQFIQQLNDKLQLTPEQKDKIGKIIAAGQERNHAIWTNAAPQMREVIQDVNRQIRRQLTPEQQKEFEELLKHPPHKSNSTNAPPNVAPMTNPPAAALAKTCA